MSATFKIELKARDIIGERVKARRVQLGMKQDELCKLTGLSQGVLSKVENGHRRARTAQMQEALASALQTTLGYLRGQTDDPTPIAPLPPANREPLVVPILEGRAIQKEHLIHSPATLAWQAELDSLITTAFRAEKHTVADVLHTWHAMEALLTVFEARDYDAAWMLDQCVRFRGAGLTNPVNYLIVAAYERFAK